MKTSNPFSFAGLNICSMFSTVLFSLTLSPTKPHARPLSLKTSFCGSMNTTAVSHLLISIVLPSDQLYGFLSTSLLFRRPFSAEVPAYLLFVSSLAEREQILIDLILMRRAHTVRRAFVNFELGVFHQLRRHHR